MGQAREVQAARRALDVLCAFTPEQPEWGVTDLSKRLAVHKSTMSRLLATMEATGFARRTAGGRYRLGPRLLELSSLVLARLDVRDMARPRLEALNQASRETVNLAIWDQDEAVNVDQVAGAQPVLSMGWVGRRTPAHASSTGKALLAFQPPEVIDRVLAKPLHAFTAATMTDGARLRQELHWIRRCGYAIAEGEFQDGLTAIAAPILARDVPAAVVSISAPSYRATRQRKGHFVQLVTNAARDLSREMETATSR